MNLFVRIILWGLLLLMLPVYRSLGVGREKTDAQSRTGMSDEKVVVVTSH